MPTKPPFHKPRYQLKHDEPRGTASERGYDAAWRRLRLAFIGEHPLCAVCETRGRTKAAIIVDHVVPIVVDPSRRLDVTNLRSVCTDCHAEITTSFKLNGINEPLPTRKLWAGGWADQRQA